ncbi:hypothetical protein ILUMI_12004 [Ignelater luminosus]|uniref:Uncharacterized protein n=1 Tax=Ignelater luminosus TaxID=2038154 RepID=A0A8K0CZ29_IGNLU|nr:hypothetical protein ILUMI_12004 [Ignelater luminosus]
MPKNRNRTVTNNFEFPPEFLKTLPYPEKVKKSEQRNTSINPLSLGEPVPSQHNNYKLNKFEKQNNSSSSGEYDNVTSGISDFDIISFGKSSSSSVSWSDEFDTEATQHVQNELERMERVLQGKEPIPPHYNRDEYEQWIKTFPQLSISGNKMKYPIRQNQENSFPNNNQEEIIAFHSDMKYLKTFLQNC